MIAIDMKTGEMEQLRPMNERRFSHTSIMLGKLIYVFGGYDDYDHGMEYLSSCERYVEYENSFQMVLGRLLNEYQLIFRAVMIPKREHGKP